MMYTKIQSQNFLSSEVFFVFVFFSKMGLAANLFKGAQPFEQTANPLLTESCPMRNLVIIRQEISKKKTFKDYTILYLYIAQGQVQITLGANFLIITKKLFYFNHTL